MSRIFDLRRGDVGIMWWIATELTLLAMTKERALAMLPLLVTARNGMTKQSIMDCHALKGKILASNGSLNGKNFSVQKGT